MRKANLKRLIFGCLAALALTCPARAEIKVVAIYPVQQETLVWCWAAVSEMVLSHYRIPNYGSDESYQCNIVKSMGGKCLLGCDKCVVGIRTMYHLSTVIRNFQKNSLDNAVQKTRKKFRVIPKKQRLSPMRIIAEIDGNNPIIAAISPSGMGYLYPDGMGEHLAVIVGYDTSGAQFTILVNDPAPFADLGYDPYLAVGGTLTIPGQYWIDYDTFVRTMVYKDSIVFERM